MAALAGIAEAGGGLLLVLGFLTPLGAAAISLGIITGMFVHSTRQEEAVIEGEQTDERRRAA